MWEKWTDVVTKEKKRKFIGYENRYVQNGVTVANGMAEAEGWTVEQLQQKLWTSRGATPPGVSVPDMARVAELFKWSGTPATITANECRWQTPGGTVVAKSDSPITWEVVK